MKLAFFGHDGEYVVDDMEFETIEDAWNWDSGERGSRWIFYPYAFVVTDSGLTVIDSYLTLEHLNGKRLKTVQRVFKQHYDEFIAGATPEELQSFSQ